MNELRQFGPDIWLADGPSVRAFGPVRLPTRMIVVRLSNGAVWINSPVEATKPQMDAVARIGAVRYLVAPTSLHVWRLAAWKAAFPAASIWTPPRVRWRSDLRSENVLGDETPAEWAQDLDQVIFRGNAFLDEVEFLHKKSRTLILADFIQNYPARPNVWFNALAYVGGVLNGGVPRDIRLSFTARSRGRSSLRTMLSWDFDKLVVAHGACVESQAKPFVENAFRWLDPA